MKNILLTLSSVLLLSTAFGQVEKRIVIEHFTNSRCGICASKNPGFYENLANFPDVIHLAYHPSSPYDDCVFSAYNATENDDRTNHYGIYGGTPRLVIQGEVKAASASFSSATLISAYEGEESAFEMTLKQRHPGTFDSLQVRLTITKVSSSSLTSAYLYGAIAESQIDYSAPNGEDVHYDVFRKALFGSNAQLIALPSAVDDSVVVERTVAVDELWQLDRSYAMAVIQDSANAVIQAVSGEGDEIMGTNFSMTSGSFLIYPNPASRIVRVQLPDSSNGALSVFDAQGKLVMQESTIGSMHELDVSSLSAGLYVVKYTSVQNLEIRRLVVE